MYSRISLFICSGLLLALTLLLAQRELVGARQATASDSLFFETAATGEIRLAPSYRTNDDLLQRCINIVGGLYGDLQPPEASGPARGHCLAAAQDATSLMPTYALGWYAQALFLGQLNKIDAANAALVKAQHLGRHEQWIAEGRVQLAESKYETLSPEVLAGHERDLELLARSRRGVQSIAYRYVSQPEFRERITTIVERLSPEDQLRFLNNVRNAARSYGMEMQ